MKFFAALVDFLRKLNQLLLPSWFFSSLVLVAVVATGFLMHLEKAELIPQLWVSLLAVGLSYWACMFTREKFRLDLLDKRFAVYEKTLEFCSRVTTGGTLHVREDNKDEIFAAIRAAHDSFRGIGYHKSRALFGKDIWDLFERLNSSYAFLTAFGGISVNDGPQYQNLPTKICEHLTFIIDTSTKLPEHFRPYVYFGDYCRKP